MWVTEFVEIFEAFWILLRDYCGFSRLCIYALNEAIVMACARAAKLCLNALQLPCNTRYHSKKSKISENIHAKYMKNKENKHAMKKA